MCLALGVDKLDDAAAKLGDVLDMQPPQGVVEKVQGLLKLKSVADSLPKTVSKGACQEIVLEGDDVDLGRLPIQRCWPGDPAPFITLPAVITKDTKTGVRNVGMYRMQVIDKSSTFMHWQMHKDGRRTCLAPPRTGGSRLRSRSGSTRVRVRGERPAPAPPGRADARRLPARRAGRARARKTIDLEVPANAEIVLEGHVSKDDVGVEGPFGDHTGYYSHAEPFRSSTSRR